MQNLQVTDADIQAALEDLNAFVLRRLESKGRNPFVSTHEALGVIVEEMDEFLDAVRRNDSCDVHDEIVDVAVGCWFALASMYATGAYSADTGSTPKRSQREDANV